MSNADVQIIVSLRDAASKNLLQQLGLINNETGKIDASAGKAGSALERMNASGKQGGAALNGMSRELDGMSRKAQAVGTHLNAGLKTALGRARELMGTLSKNMGKGIVVAGGAAAAGAAILKPQVDYDRQMSLNAGIMFGTKTDDGRAYTRKEADAQKSRLTAQVDTAVDGGVGTRQQGMDAQNILLQSGKFNGEEGMARIAAMLPQIMKSSAATGTDPEATAAMAMAFVEKGLNDKQVNAALGKGMVADGMGAFGMKDMAKWMPKWLSGAGKSLDGEHAADSLLVHAQTVRKSAGSADEAGVNLENLIGYVTSDKGDKALKGRGIDREKEVSKNMAGGDDFIEGYARMMNKAVANDAGFQALKQKAAAEKTDEGKARVLNEMAGYTEQGVIGDVVADLQARKALMAEMLALDKNGEIKTAVKKEDGSTVQTAYEQRVKGDAKTSVDATGNAKDTGLTSVLNQLSPALGAAAQWFGNFAKENPLATGAGVLGVGMAGGGAMSGMGFNLIKSLFGVAAPASGAAATAAAVGVEAAGVATAASWLSKAGGLVKGAGVVGMGVAAGANVVSDAATVYNGSGSAVEQGSAKGGLAGAGVGAVVGGVIGSVVPVLGTALGAAAGAWLGGIAGEWVGGKLATPTQPAVSPALSTAANPDILRASTAMLTAANAAQAPSGQALIQSDAQLQQVNAQMSQLVQVANNAPVQQSLQAVQAGISQLNAKNYTMTATIPVYIDGSMVSQSVNKINTHQAYRNGVG